MRQVLEHHLISKLCNFLGSRARGGNPARGSSALRHRIDPKRKFCLEFLITKVDPKADLNHSRPHNKRKFKKRPPSRGGSQGHVSNLNFLCDKVSSLLRKWYWDRVGSHAAKEKPFANAPRRRLHRRSLKVFSHYGEPAVAAAGLLVYSVFYSRMLSSTPEMGP
jgi:hypothetical protein